MKLWFDFFSHIISCSIYQNVSFREGIQVFFHCSGRVGWYHFIIEPPRRRFGSTIGPVHWKTGTTSQQGFPQQGNQTGIKKIRKNSPPHISQHYCIDVLDLPVPLGSVEYSMSLKRNPPCIENLELFAGCFCQINIANWQEKCHIYNIYLYMYCQLGDYMPKNRSMKATHFLHHEKPSFQTSGRVSKSQQKSNFPDPNKPGWCFFRKKPDGFLWGKNTTGVSGWMYILCINLKVLLGFFSAMRKFRSSRFFGRWFLHQKKGWTHLLYKHS